MPIIVIAIAAIFGLSVTSDGARPGDILFPLDTLVEEAQALGTFDNSSKANLRTKFAAERVKEVQELIASGKAQGLEVAILNLETNFNKAVDELKAMRKTGTINKETFQTIKKALKEQRDALKKLKEEDETDAEDEDLLDEADKFLEIEEDRLEALEEERKEAAEKLQEVAKAAVKEASESAERANELKKRLNQGTATTSAEVKEEAEASEKQVELFREQAKDLEDNANEIKEDKSGSSNSESGSSGSGR